jgi:hypothetical protein
MKKGKCSKSFPKLFKRATTFEDNGFVYCKGCHQHDNFILKYGIQLYNEYVVLYNRELLLRYNAHINVEVVEVMVPKLKLMSQPYVIFH